MHRRVLGVFPEGEHVRRVHVHRHVAVPALAARDRLDPPWQLIEPLNVQQVVAENRHGDVIWRLKPQRCHQQLAIVVVVEGRRRRVGWVLHETRCDHVLHIHDVLVNTHFLQ